MECGVVGFESLFGFCLLLSLADKRLLCMLCNFRSDLESLSCLLKVISHRKNELPHLEDRFLVFDHSLYFVPNFVEFETMRLARHHQSVLEH